MIREEKGREEGKKFPSIYSANFVVARGRRGGGGEEEGNGGEIRGRDSSMRPRRFFGKIMLCRRRRIYSTVN